jgi:uncharacterized membrane protein
MNKRPLIVTIIGWLLIVVGVAGLAYHAKELSFRQPIQFENVAILVLRLIAIVSGVFLLKGRNWARWLSLAWIGLHVFLSFFHSLQQVLMHGLLFVLIGYALMRPEARVYFNRSKKENEYERNT